MIASVAAQSEGASTHARAASRHLGPGASLGLPPAGGAPGRPAGAAAGASTGASAGAQVHTRARGAPDSSNGKDLLGLHIPAQTGQAMMVALIALGAAILLALLFSEEIGLVLARVTQRPRS
ncbi:MAG TPA: hypothetical protein VNZ05_04995 [Solirubrobacteraceae bacterium]|nr:hypothetical protein [Solirubrobacteraceae bacterium]